MKLLIKELMKEKRTLEKIIAVSERNKNNLPSHVDDMGVRAMIKGNSVQLYVRDDINMEKYKYVNASDKQKVIDFLNQEYYKSVIVNANNEIKAIDRLLKDLEHKSINSVYENLGKAKKTSC